MDPDPVSLSHSTKPPYSWAVWETEELVTRYEAGSSVEELSEWSGRSPHHVVVQIAWAMCGVGRDDVDPLAPRFREPWSDDELAQVGVFVQAGLSLGKIAQLLERDITDVAWRLVIEHRCYRGISLAG